VPRWSPADGGWRCVNFIELKAGLRPGAGFRCPSVTLVNGLSPAGHHQAVAMDPERDVWCRQAIEGSLRCAIPCGSGLTPGCLLSHRVHRQAEVFSRQRWNTPAAKVTTKGFSTCWMTLFWCTATSRGCRQHLLFLRAPSAAPRSVLSKSLLHPRAGFSGISASTASHIFFRASANPRADESRRWICRQSSDLARLRLLVTVVEPSPRSVDVVSAVSAWDAARRLHVVADSRRRNPHLTLPGVTRTNPDPAPSRFQVDADIVDEQLIRLHAPMRGAIAVMKPWALHSAHHLRPRSLPHGVTGRNPTTLLCRRPTALIATRTAYFWIMGVGRRASTLPATAWETMVIESHSFAHPASRKPSVGKPHEIKGESVSPTWWCRGPAPTGDVRALVQELPTGSARARGVPSLDDIRFLLTIFPYRSARSCAASDRSRVARRAPRNVLHAQNPSLLAQLRGIGTVPRRPGKPLPAPRPCRASLRRQETWRAKRPPGEKGRAIQRAAPKTSPGQVASRPAR